MKILSRILFLLSVCVFVCSCNEQTSEYCTMSHVTFVNNSTHIISVAFDESGTRKIEDFTLKPNEMVRFSYEPLGLIIDKATVTFDGRISIIHRIRDELRQDGFRNMCHTGQLWWAKSSYRYEKYYTYRFNDDNYAVKMGQIN